MLWIQLKILQAPPLKALPSLFLSLTYGKLVLKLNKKGNMRYMIYLSVNTLKRKAEYMTLRILCVT